MRKRSCDQSLTASKIDEIEKEEVKRPVEMVGPVEVDELTASKAKLLNTTKRIR